MIELILSEPWLAGVIVFILGSIGLAVFMWFTSTRKWHDGHHGNRSELMCDHCTERMRVDFLNAPPRRILGG